MTRDDERTDPHARPMPMGDDVPTRIADSVGLAHVVRGNELLEEIRDHAERSADAEVALVELAGEAWWWARTLVMVGGVLLGLGGIAIAVVLVGLLLARG